MHRTWQSNPWTRDRPRFEVLRGDGRTATGVPPWRGIPVCVIVAHPEDETIGCGAQLSRNATVVVATDGAPRNLMQANACGFDTASEFAAARAREFRGAMRIAGVAETSVVQIGVPDRDAAHYIQDITLMLACVMLSRGIRFAITHAYEGGDPDHDAVACAAWAACRLLDRSGHAVSLYEMPLYRQGTNGKVHQSFVPNNSAAELTLSVDGEPRARKRRMLACYTTQRRTLFGFAIGPERFRPMPRHDFTMLPNDGAPLYEYHEHHDRGVRTGAEWKELAGRALVELDLIARPTSARPWSQD